MPELTPGQEKLNAKLTGYGAGFDIADRKKAQELIDLARQCLEEKVKDGENFDDFIRVEPEDDKQFSDQDFIRTYRVCGEVCGKEVEIACAEIHYQIDKDEEGKDVVEYYTAKIRVDSKSLRNGLGIGKDLMSRIEKDARSMNCDKLTVLAMKSVGGGKHPYYFYKKMGFVPNANFLRDDLEKDIEENRILGVLMEKKLDNN